MGRLTEPSHVRHCLFKHVIKARRGWGGSKDREGEPMCLVGAVIRVLPDDDDADVRPTTEGEGGEHQGVGWVDDLLARSFLGEEGEEACEVGFVGFVCH
jgi:hypothetical protein